MVTPAPGAEEQVIDRLWATIPPLWHQMRAHVRAVASERFGVNVLQFRVLRHIRAGTRSASDLAAALQTSRPAVSQCVDALVEKGLVARQRSAEDRRYVDLAVTRRGGEMLDTIFAENRRWMMRRLAALSPEELAHILAGMEALHAAFLP